MYDRSMSSEGSAAAITTVWPSGFDADASGPSGFAVREVAAPAGAVFAWLRRVDLHPEYYTGLMGLSGVKHKGGAWPELDAGSKLSFALGHLPIPAVRISQCDVAELRLAWSGGGPGLSACHAWTVLPTGADTCLLRSEEKWVGPTARVLGVATQWRLQQVQSDWAQAVADAATAYPAGPPAHG